MNYQLATMRRIGKLVVSAAGSLLLLTACTVTSGHAAIEAAGLGANGAGTSAAAAALVADATPSHTGHHATAAVTDVPLDTVNTGSVLFPMHTLHQEALDSQMQSYLGTFRDIPAQVLQVRQSEHARSGPGNFYESLELLQTGAEVTVDGESASWYRLADGAGYVPKFSLIDPATGQADEGIVWEMKVVNSGDSETINECAGGLTEFTAMSEDLGVPAYAMHSYCGGEPILTLAVGDAIKIDGVRYDVISTNDFPLFGSTELMRHLVDEDAFLQACDLAKGFTHMVGLAKTGTEVPAHEH